MTRRQLTWLLATMLAVPALLLAAFGFLAGTESGTRWLLNTSRPYLPEAITLGEPTGTLLGGVALDRFAWSDEAIDIQVQDLQIDLELIPLIDGQIRLKTLAVAAIAIDVQESEPSADSGELPVIDLPLAIHVESADLRNIRVTLPSVERRIQSLQFSGSLDNSELTLSRLELLSVWADLSVAGTLRLAGRYPADLSVSWRYQQSGDLELAGSGDLSGNRRRYNLSHNLQRPLQVESRGTLQMPGDVLLFDLTHRWDALQWSVAERRVAAGSGSLLTGGSINDVTLNLQTSAVVDDYPQTQVSLIGVTDLRSLRIESLGLSNELGNVSASGDLGWTGTPFFNLDITASGLDPSILSEALAGEIAFASTVTGTLPENADPKTDILLTAISGTLNGSEISGSSSLAVDGSTIGISAAELTVGRNTLSLEGRIADEMDLAAAFKLNALDEIDERLKGTLSGQARITGQRITPAVSISMTGDGTGWNDTIADRFELTGSLSPDESFASEMRVDGVLVGTSRIDEVLLSLAGTLDEHKLELALRNTEGHVELSGSGGLVASDWRGRLDRLEIDTLSLANWSLQDVVNIEASADRTSVSRFCLASRSNEGRACAGLNYDTQAGGSGQLDLERFPLAALPLELPAGATAFGFVEAKLDLTIDSAGIRGDGKASLIEAAIETLYDDEPLRLTVSTAELATTIDNNRLTSSLNVRVNDDGGVLDVSLDVSDVSDNESAILGTGTLTIPDASVFAVFLPDVANSSGTINGNFAVAGSLNAPDFNGEILLEDSAFDVRPAGIRITDLNLKLAQTSAGELSLDGNARSGGGDISITGETRIGADSGLRTELALTGERFELVELPDWQVSASPDIRLVLDDSAAVVTGSLDVPTANITVNSLPETAMRPSADVVVHGEAAVEPIIGRRINVDVMTSLGEEVRLAGYGLSTRVAGAVRIRGGSAQPYTGTGSLNLIEGRYKAYGQNLEIENGELIFNGPLESPQLNIQAVRRLDEYDVIAGIRLTGTPTRLVSTVYSEPVMSDAESLTYLLTGRPLSSPGESENADILNQAAFALGLSQAGSITSQIQGELGLDTLKLEGGTETGRIIAGKRIGEKLLVEYGYGLIDNLGSLMLRYQLTNDLILESRTGIASELDILYSIRKK